MSLLTNTQPNPQNSTPAPLPVYVPTGPQIGAAPAVPMNAPANNNGSQNSFSHLHFDINSTFSREDVAKARFKLKVKEFRRAIYEYKFDVAVVVLESMFDEISRISSRSRAQAIAKLNQKATILVNKLSELLASEGFLALDRETAQKLGGLLQLVNNPSIGQYIECMKKEFKIT